MVQSSCSVKNGKLNETIEASALWSRSTVGTCDIKVELFRLCCTHIFRPTSSLMVRVLFLFFFIYQIIIGISPVLPDKVHRNGWGFK